MTTAAEAHAVMRGLPFADVSDITTGHPVLVIAPHPDDEVIGCAGMIVRSLAAGVSPVVTIVTDGSGSHPNSVKFPPQAVKTLRMQEARQAATELGLPPDRLHFLDYRDTAAPHDGPGFDRGVERLVELALRYGCRVICAPWRLDPHGDHLAVHKMAVKVAAALRLRHLSYPVWGWMLPGHQELGPLDIRGLRLDITDLLARKHRALKAHATQYAGIIDDDPTGFQLTGDILDKFIQPFEVYLDNP